jgi:general secretion pathway protein E
VLRLLGRSDRLPQLSELGVSEAQTDALLGLVGKPNGVVLVSGPTGSGKTTTIYRLLVHLNKGVRKIVTVEDPVEFDLPGVVQMQARSDIGLSFAAGLRSILRQDPDVIMIGEVRDRETAAIAVQAALTGHLVISTIHTNSALAAVPRLLDLGVEPFLLSDVVRGLVGQRLVRRLCPHCAAPSDADRIASYEAARPPMARRLGAADWREPMGCAKCANTGYLGRLGLYEIAPSSAALEHDIRHRASEEALTRTARAEGFVSLAEDGYAKARAGLTTLAELRRVAGGAADAPAAPSAAAE